MLRLKTIANICMKIQSKSFSNSYPMFAESTMQYQGEREESARMKKFHEQLKLEPMPRVGPSERFVDLVLVNIDPKNGELIPDSEKNPTKWGDWQHHGRVTDF